MHSKFYPLLLLLLAISFLKIAAAQESEENSLTDTDNEKQTTHEEDDDLELLKEHGAFLGSFISILVTEIGDKTFIISAVLAVRYSKLWVFIGGYGALFLMTFISCFIGSISVSILPEFYIKLVAALLFFIFGGKAVYEAVTNKIEAEDDEIEHDLQILQQKLEGGGQIIEQDSKPQNNEQNVDIETRELQASLLKTQEKQNKKNEKHNVSNLMVAGQTFVQNFLGEWGDRSQLSTIAMSTSFDFLKVFLGSALGHALCTYLAVTGGKMLAEKFSERTLTLIGGILFIIYGIITVIAIM